MLRLLLDGNEMDLYQNESVNLTMQFADVQEINSSLGSYSQTFRLPATPTNLDFFGPIDESTVVGGQSLKTRIPAEILSGTVPLLRGYVQVKSVYLQKEKYADIEVCFFSGVADLRTEVAGKLLSDLDLSAYDHTLNYANVTGSWLGLGIGPEVRYGLIDKGFNWSFPDNVPWTTRASPTTRPSWRTRARVSSPRCTCPSTTERRHPRRTPRAKRTHAPRSSPTTLRRLSRPCA
jgi:hypothetical protein